MEILEYWRILKKHLIMILVMCISAGLIAALLAEIIQEKYEATALVLVRPEEKISISPNTDTKELLNFPVMSGGGHDVETPSNTYIEIIGSRTIAEKVVHKLSLDKAEEEGAAETFFDEVVDFLKETVKDFTKVTLQVLKYGRVIGEETPFEEAVEDVQENISLEAIIGTHLFEITYVGRPPQQTADVVNTAAEIFREYMNEIDGAEAQGSLAFLEERLEDSHKELMDARRALRELKERYKTISFEEETTEKIKNLSALEKNLVDKEVILAGLLEEYSPKNPLVLHVQAEKDTLLSTLTEEKTAMQERPQREHQLATLELSLDLAKDIYQLIKKEYEEARIRGAKYTSEVRVVSQATPPMYPTEPLRALYVGAAVTVAFLVGVGIAFVVEFFNMTIRTTDDAEKNLQVRVLATVPLVRTSRKYRFL